jgi:cytochrome c2
MSEPTVQRWLYGWAGLLLAVCAVGIFSLAALASDRDTEELQVPDAAESCESCHAMTPDEQPLVGPTLWKVVGRPVASVPGFDYSPALKSLGGTWTRERLDQFLTSPQAYAPGTRMDLGGVRIASDRERVLDFLETLKPAPAGSSSDSRPETPNRDSPADATVSAAKAP